MNRMKVVALAGGVGGARLSDGLARVLPGENLTVVVNVGDDFEHFGLKICPDLDTVCYTLSHQAHPVNGWGRAGESWHALDAIRSLGGPDWFQIGDRDLGLHLERTRRIRAGLSLSGFCIELCRRWNIPQRILPVSDDVVQTIVHTATEGALTFQEYFVREKYQPAVVGFEFRGAGMARAAPGVLADIEAADYVIICPSNPWVSIDPILAIPGVRKALKNKVVVAVSPIIGDSTVKGPAAKMYRELGLTPSALAVAGHYQDMLRGFVFDRGDANQTADITRLGVIPFATDSIMVGVRGRIRLAREILRFCQSLECV